MRYVNLHTHLFTHNPEILEIVNQYPDQFDADLPNYSVGIHPWHIDLDRLEADLQLIAASAKLEGFMAVGECGLDKRIDTPFEVQQTVFEKQLLLAQEYGKPVIVHCVAAFQELIRIKRFLKIEVPMIVHGFSKNTQLAKQLTDDGFYLSFGKYLLSNPELGSVFQLVDDTRVFLETDTIQDSLADVYALAARFKGMEVADLERQIDFNFTQVFGRSLR